MATTAQTSKRINLVKKGQIVKSIWRKRTPIVAQGERRRGK